MIVFDLGVCVQASHTPCPSREGRFGCCVLVGNERFVVLFFFSKGECTAFWPLVGFYREMDFRIGVSRNEVMVSSRKQANIVYIPCMECVRSLI